MNTETIPCVPSCDGVKGCPHPVSRIDRRGFVYCERHGQLRKQYEPCRKLRPSELTRLASGETIRKY
jgi:hypothetical protein